MTPEQIMSKARELYDASYKTMSLSGARKAAATAATLIYHLAKLHLPETEQRKVVRRVKAPKAPKDLKSKKGDFHFD